MQENNASLAEIQEALGGIDYPVGKPDLVTHAKQNNAPREVMEMLQALPEQEYGSPIAVSKAVGEKK